MSVLSQRSFGAFPALLIERVRTPIQLIPIFAICRHKRVDRVDRVINHVIRSLPGVRSIHDGHIVELTK